MRWARAIAWASVVGLSCGSMSTTAPAAWRFSPVPAASICPMSSRWPSASVNACTSAKRSRGSTLPVMRPETSNSRSTASRTAEEIAEEQDLDAGLAVLVEQVLEPLELGATLRDGPPHPHEIPRRDLVRVGRQLVGAEIDPLLLVDARGQLLQDVLLVAAQVDVGDLGVEVPGPAEHATRPLQERVQVAGALRRQRAEEVHELLRVVLERSAGHEADLVRPVGDADQRLRAARLGVLDVVRLVRD